MSYVSVKRRGAGLCWEIRRPERGNALGTTLAAELHGALATLERDAQGASALVLTAEPVVRGTRRTWIAGGDLKELRALPDKTAARAYAQQMADVVHGLMASPLPVIAAVEGGAIGGGAELALAASLRVMTVGSHFEMKQLAVGLATGYGTAKRLVDLVGLARAESWLLLQRRVAADEALACGLVAAVEPDAKAMEARVDEWCASLAKLAPEAIAAQKAMFRDAVTLHPGSTREAELERFVRLWGNPAHAKFLTEFGA